MTLRIFTQTGPAGGALALHGRLSAAEVGELEKALAALGRPAHIDLAHLSGADAVGLAALRRLKAGGICLTGASPYVELLLGATGDADRDELSPLKDREPA